jgi:hypothetical protein
MAEDDVETVDVAVETLAEAFVRAKMGDAAGAARATRRPEG